MNMIDVMKRLAELDAKNPNRVKETKDSNQTGNFLDRYNDQDRKDIEAASHDALTMKVTKADEKKSFKDLMKLANQVAPMKKDKKGVAEGNDPNYQYSDDYSEWKRNHDINNSQRISNPPTPKSSKYPANSREDLEDRLASAKERLAMLNPDRPADRSSFADYKYVIANLERALANMNNVSEEGNADQVYENPTGSTNPKDYDFTHEVVNPAYDDSVEYADDDPIGYYLQVGVKIGRVSGSIVPARVKYDDYDHPDESDLEVEFEVYDLATGEDITHSLEAKSPEDYAEISNQAYERVVNSREDDFEESAQDDLTLESIRMLSGIKKTIAECGIGEMSMTGAPSVPASINITAANGPELSNMLKDIMSLAGLHKVEPEHLGLEREPTVISAEPSMSTTDSDSDTMDMRSMISKIDSLNPVDDQAGDEDEEDMELEELAPVQGNTPADPTKVPSMKADAMINKGMHNQDQSGNPEAGDRMDGTMPKAFPAYESLMKEYQAFIKG